jgi:hypothetical protein
MPDKGATRQLLELLCGSSAVEARSETVLADTA